MADGGLDDQATRLVSLGDDISVLALPAGGESQQHHPPKFNEGIKPGRGLVKGTKTIVILASLCLLLTAPTLAYGAQMVQPAILGWGEGAAASGEQRLSFVPQEQCAQNGCLPVGSAAYVVGNLTYHGGSVMHSVTNYAIFWLPAGFHFDNSTIDRPYPNASDTNYEALVGQYFRDVSNTAYYSILSQYGDHAGAPGIATSFGGSWVDTTPYPKEGSKTNPLQDSDIRAEVTKAMSMNGWSAGLTSAFFVFTGQNAFSCAGSGCSYKDFCAYHSAFRASDGQQVVYANVPDPGNANNGSCLATLASLSIAPNSGAFADSAVNLVAHEQFEMVTDPVFNGWYYQDGEHEIADQCAWKFGSVARDGSNIILNGHKYLVPEMWSNVVGGCFIPPVVTTLPVVASYQVQGGGSGSTPPRFTYYSGGVFQNTSLSTTPQTLNVDFRSPWNVTRLLSGSTSTERWQTPQAAGGVLGFGGNFSFSYYHQYLVNFGFGVLGGGSAYLAPSLTITQFGSQASVTAVLLTGSGSWADAGSSYDYPSQLPGSGPDERWIAQSASGTVATGGPVSLQYYHQYLVPISFSGGGSGSSAPVFVYSSLGRALGTPLGPQSQSLWLDSGVGYSATNPLIESNQTARWFAPHGAGVVSSANALQLTYYRQYFVSIRGGAAPSDWFNSTAQTTVTTPGVYARDLGAGLRVTGYRVDGGALQSVAPTIGQVSVALQMNGPHSLEFATVPQYQVSLDSGASAALLSITSPTAVGDSPWYDSGSSVTLVLNGVWGRDSSAGSRLVSYATDGGTPTNLATTGPVAVMQSFQISSPHSLTAGVTTQYRLSTQGGSVQSATVSSIPGDSWWYDSGTKVAVSYNYFWSESLGSRMSALGITVDGAPSQVSRSGTGTFQESVVMDRAHVLDVVPVVQYLLSVSGGSALAISPQSPTGDGFYDSGSSVSVSSARTWDVAPLSRIALVSYSLDGGSSRTLDPVDASGSFSTPSITFDLPRQVVFGSTTQYLVGFRFTDALGSEEIIPSSFQIGTSPNATLTVQGSRAWIEAGSTLVIKQLVWGSMDVKPLSQVVLVDTPQNVTIAARVYDATLRVSDYLQIPISGASADIRLANGTSITRTTGADGTISMTSIPLGRFNATVSYLGASQGISGDVAAQNKQVDVRLPASLPDFGALAAGAALAALIAYAAVRRKRGT